MTKNITKLARPTKFEFGDGRMVRVPKNSELPKLPPRAVEAVLAVYERHGIDPEGGVGTEEMENPKNMPFFIELATVAVARTLKRIDRSVTENDLMDDADLDDVLGLFPSIAKRNPRLFGAKGGKKAPPKKEDPDENPTSAGSE